ncbi:AmmeMemoRadiSam system radical SAM enzyme [candidate division WOR-3 bacterium]|nr:AmmeMemoRadiSam system radical SAM enzyme [candidate division WOR-3 bacterium]
MKEAEYYDNLDNERVRCKLCPIYCIITPDKCGQCRGRKNINGKLYAINFGETTSTAMDTIEKKPLYHFHPGKLILSISPNSCNMKCPWCQNAEISQEEFSTRFVSPEDMVGIAIENTSFGIAYTYTEPLTWFEYLKETGRIAKDRGLKNVLVTNGMINEQPLLDILPLIDAMNIDIKSMNPDVYKRIVKGDLDTVLNTIRISKKHCHIEITNLLIPEFNDSKEDISKLIDFVEDIGKDTPLHFSRYFPHYKWTTPSTPASTIIMAYKMAKERLHYVYVGNIFMQDISNNTYCPDCNNLLVERSFMSGRIVGVNDAKCSKCGRKVDIVMT